MRLKVYIYILGALLMYYPAILRGQALLIIPESAYVVQQNGNLVVGKNLVNNGSFTQNGGRVVFGGTTQSLEGAIPIQFRDILVSSGSTTTINTDGQTLSRTLLCNGTLQANGKLTLLSTSGQTALIDGTGTGQVLGNVTMQRYIASAYGYKYFSSPFQDATVNQFSDELNLAADFKTFYRYIEDVTSTGWHPYVTTSGLLNPLEGYAGHFGTAATPVTVDITGVVNNGTVSAPTLYNSNRTYTQGFHLVGNPYPSPIDWDAPTGWTRTNIDNAVYYFNTSTTDQYGGTYSSYINGISSDGIASNIISSLQGFFIHVSDGSYPVAANLSVTNAVRTTNLSTVFYRTTGLETPLVRLTARLGDTGKISDPAVVYFDEGASMKYDQSFDALKMMNTDADVPNLYVLADATKLSISAMPYPSDSIHMIPLGLENGKAGWITFTAPDMQHIPLGTYIYLDDNVTGIRQDLSANPEYKVLLNANKYENRFSLVFSRKDLSNDPVTNGLQAYSTGGKVFVYLNLVTGEKGDLVISNMLGQVMSREALSGYGYHEITTPFSNGVYIVTFYSRNGAYSRKLYIENN